MKLTVFASSRADIVALEPRYQKAHRAWRRRAKSLLRELGLAERNIMTEGGWRSTRRFVGVSWSYNEDPPEGWKFDGKHCVLLPRMSTKAGKAIADKLAACQPPTDPRDELPGMPAHHLDGLRACAPGLEIRNRDVLATVYVKWGCALPLDRVDLGIWRQVPLSEYYALVEAEEQQAAST